MSEDTTRLSSKYDGPPFKLFSTDEGNCMAVVGDAIAIYVGPDDQGEPMVTLVTYKDGLGIFMAYSKPDDLERFGRLCIESAEELRIKPRREPEVGE